MIGSYLFFVLRACIYKNLTAISKHLRVVRNGKKSDDLF